MSTQVLIFNKPLGIDSTKLPLALPMANDFKPHTVLASVGLYDTISRIVFSYLFDIDTRFGSLFSVLQEQNEKDFEKASKKIHSSKKGDEEGYVSYPCEGAKDYSCFGLDDVSHLFLQHMRSKNTPSYLHLDIGGGSGDFALALEQSGKKMGCSVEGHTVSASDLRAVNSQVSDERYHICNASQILNYSPIASRAWNSITCITTMVYFEDNFKNLADFYELLAPGGLLVANSLYFLGIHKQVKEIVEFLNEMGYAIIAFYQKRDLLRHHISTIILQKTHPHLNFPILYDKDRPYVSDHGNYRALYALDDRFIKTKNEKARQKQISVILHRWGNKLVMEDSKSVFPKTHSLSQLYRTTVEQRASFLPSE